MSDDQRAAARVALLDPEVQAIRRECLASLAEGMSLAGERLRVVGALFGPPPPTPSGARDVRVVGMGYVATMGADLLGGVNALLGERNPYAAAALLRQVVEVEYLAWAFAEDQREAGAWLESSQEERRARWQPRQLRQRSNDRFRGKDYSTHCEQGGHPTPDGARVLLNGPWELNEAALTTDALVHGRSTWRYLIEAVDGYADAGGWTPEQLLPFDARVMADNAVESWWEYDPFKPFIVAGGALPDAPDVN